MKLIVIVKDGRDGGEPLVFEAPNDAKELARIACDLLGGDGIHAHTFIVDKIGTPDELRSYLADCTANPYFEIDLS